MKHWLVPLAIISTVIMLFGVLFTFEIAQSLICISGSNYYKTAFVSMGFATFVITGLVAGWVIYGTQQNPVLRIVFPAPFVLFSLMSVSFVFAVQFDIWLPDAECPFLFI